jgi:hypothetical protein
MARLPSTKPKQREHVERLLRLVDNLTIYAGKEPSTELRLLKQGLHDLYEQMFNRKGPKGRPVSDPVTRAKITQVLRVRDEHPGWSQQEIAYATNINIGRVSEILHGKRT